MKRTVTVTVEQIRRVTVRSPRSPGPNPPPLEPGDRDEANHPQPAKGEVMHRKKKILIGCLFTALAVLPARPQGPPLTTGLQAPTRVIFTTHGNLIVAEAGTTAPNSGRISLVERTSGTRRTLIDGLPSGIAGAGAEAAPSGPSGLALRGTTLYVAIGAGNGVVAGPAPGSELPNDSPSSPILSSLLSLQTTTPLDLIAGGFSLLPSDHARLRNGESVQLTGANGQQLTVRLIADFPNFAASPRPDVPQNVRASNPFGVAVLGQTAFVVDASLNLIRRVDTNTGAFETLTTFAPIQNPLPFGPPFIDAVPDSIVLRGNDLLVTTLTGFPFPQGRAEVRRVNITTGANERYAGDLTSAIDVQPLAGTDSVVALEFSTNMREQQPGRLRLVSPQGASATLASNLPTPTSIAVDQRTSEIFVTHIFPGLLTRVGMNAGTLPPAPPPAVIPVVASLPGANGSQFTTSLQISNPHPFPISGQLVVHPEGAVASPMDSALAYRLAPFQTQHFPDFLGFLRVRGGASVDVMPGVGSAPITVTTITNTAAEGKPTIQVPQVNAADALAAGTRGTLIGPSDPAAMRFNIGVRTLQNAASLTFRVHNRLGAELRAVTRVFPPMYFQQFSSADLLGGALGANEAVVVTVNAGSAIVYGVAIDNTTGHGVLQIARATSE